MTMALIWQFLRIISADEQAKAAKKDLCLRVTFTGSGECFYLRFRKGGVDAGLGNYAPDAQISLQMPLEIFDGMMTGKINGARAAMAGKMTFTGSAQKAMRMQPELKLMMRCYQEALGKIHSAPQEITCIS